MTADPFARFVEAQAPVYGVVLAELSAGRKVSHWMWFVFPQLAGLGSSARSRHYALHARDEAARYAAHPLLGPRLLECTRLVNAVPGRSAREILGSPDDLKFHSSMTLFAVAVPDEPVFAQALDRFFDGVADPATLALLGAMD